MSPKLHNPKSHSPALYITCWLSQVPVKLLSDGAKLTYGRLSQWSNESGIVYRSAKQLGQELGKSEGSIEKYLKQLRDVKLIGTYHPQAGGVNHYEFYDHPWMHLPINTHLVYKKDRDDPPPDVTVPPVRSYGTLPPDVTDINKKEIKEIKCVGEDSSHTQNSSKIKKELAEQSALLCPKINALFEARFSGLDVSLEQLFEACQEHYEQKSLWATKDKFLKWVQTENLENYQKENKKSSRDPSMPSTIDFQEHHAGVKGYEWVGEWIQKQKK